MAMAWCRSLAASVAAAGIGLAVAATLAAGGNSAPAGGELRAVSAADVASLDPALVQEPLGWEIMLATCTTLFVDDAGGGSPRLLPEAAAAFPSISNNGLIYVFTIRPGLRRRVPLTAAAYARAVGRVLDPPCTTRCATIRVRDRRRACACEPPHHPVVASARRSDRAPDDAVGLPGSAGLPIDPTGVDTIPDPARTRSSNTCQVARSSFDETPSTAVRGRSDPGQSTSPSAAQPTPTCSQSNRAPLISTSTSSPSVKRRHRSWSSTSPHATASAAANSSLGPSTRRCSSR